ncbi:MAG: hypothetical protein VYB13_01165, partial [Chloroflexota bacterium]|nr:hypothetical protein [Chloroflexota bacterium]
QSSLLFGGYGNMAYGLRWHVSKVLLIFCYPALTVFCPHSGTYEWLLIWLLHAAGLVSYIL